MIDEKLKPAGN